MTKKKNHRKKKKKNKKRYRFLGYMFIIALILCNISRIGLFLKGYSLSEQNVILKMNYAEIEKYLKQGGIDIASWEMEENDQHYMEYQACYDYIEDMNEKNKENKEWVRLKKDNLDIIRDVDEIYGQLEELNSLGYDKDTVWQLLSKMSASNLKLLIESSYTYEELKEIMDLVGYQPDDFKEYIESGLPIQKAILQISYPHIESFNIPVETYILEKPDSLVALVKSGFSIQNYKPEELVEISFVSEDCVNRKLRKECALAFEKMIKDANQEGYGLLMKNGYQVLNNQLGINEHQTGLALDLEIDSLALKWLENHSYQYGFVQRYPLDKEEITGAKEPNHFRYVGKKVALQMYTNDWTLEEYILNNGFSYNLNKQ